MEVHKIMALFLLCLATTTSVGWCRMVDTSPQEVTHDQAKQRDARADWVASKISEGVGASSNIQKIMASSKVSTETMGEKLYDVKSHTSEMASDKTGSAMQTAKETASDAYESMSGQGRKTMESASEMADEAKNEASKAYEASGPTMESAGNAADKAKNEASKAYEASGPTMESAGNIASEMAEKIKEGAQSAYDFAMGKVHVSTGEDVQNAYTYASDKAGQGMSDASDKASDAMSWASEKAGGAKEVMKEKASDAYNSVSHKTGETVRMTTEDNANSASYEQAREKAYDAYLYTGDKFEGAKEAAAAHAVNK